MTKDNNDTEIQFDEDVLLEEEVKEPKLYKVLLHNDDYTTMEFVITLLVDIFRKDAEQASIIMLNIHKEGIGLCGIYTHEIAETKVMQVHAKAREASFPLKATLEEV